MFFSFWDDEDVGLDCGVSGGSFDGIPEAESVGYFVVPSFIGFFVVEVGSAGSVFVSALLVLGVAVEGFEAA